MFGDETHAPHRLGDGDDRAQVVGQACELEKDMLNKEKLEGAAEEQGAVVEEEEVVESADR